MSEIPFVNNLGDALERAIVPQTARGRRRLRGRPWRLALVLALLVAGAAGAAQTLLSSPTQRAAINGIGCYDGTNDSAGGAFDVYGPSPIAACRRIYRAEHSALARPEVRLIACVGGQGPIAMVFKADGNPDQCRRLGFSALPTTYAAAAADVATLNRAILATWRSANCTPRLRSRRSSMACSCACAGRAGTPSWRLQAPGPVRAETSASTGTAPPTRQVR
jgi:hypothetical protein